MSPMAAQGSQLCGGAGPPAVPRPGEAETGGGGYSNLSHLSVAYFRGGHKE